MKGDVATYLPSEKATAIWKPEMVHDLEMNALRGSSPRKGGTRNPLDGLVIAENMATGRVIGKRGDLIIISDGEIRFTWSRTVAYISSYVGRELRYISAPVNSCTGYRCRKP